MIRLSPPPMKFALRTLMGIAVGGSTLVGGLFPEVARTQTLLTYPGSAEKQQRADNLGFRFGRVRLHPTLGITTTYDSNALYSSTDPVADFIYQISPGLELDLHSSKLDLTSNAKMAYRDNLVEDIQDDLQYEGGFLARYHVSRRFTFEMGDIFQKGADPATIEVPERVDKFVNEAKAAITYETPAKDLDFGLGYTNLLLKYDSSAFPQSFYNNELTVTSRINLSSHFRFLPKSVLATHLVYGRTTFEEDPTQPTTNSDSQGLSLMTGLNSQFTRKLYATVNGGVTFAFFDDGTDTNQFTGGASLKYRFNERLYLGCGYERRFEISSFADFYTDDSVLVEGRWRVARRFELVTNNSIDFLEYSGSSTVPSGETRNDLLIRSTTGVLYDIVAWAVAKVEYGLELRDTNAVYSAVPGSDADFTRQTINVGAEFRY